ncbi:TPA: sensor histidine kinase [Providencia alcalifaciens]
MKIKSFLVYTFGIQVGAVIFLWLLLVGWLQFFYLPDLVDDDEFNQQQQIVTQGIARTLGTVSDTPEYFDKLAVILQKMYTDAMENGIDTSYKPYMVVRDPKGHVLYRNSEKISDPSLKSVEQLTNQYKDWHFTSAWDDDHSLEVVIAESYLERRKLIGNPAEETAIPLAFILGIMLIAILITAYFSIRPIKQVAKVISSRQPGNLTAIAMKDVHKETRPIISAINQLMARVDAANLREKRFMADAAHELRTPIAAVTAQLHLLMNIDNPKEKAEIINDMKETLTRAASLSHQLIDLARLEAEDFSIRKEQVDLPMLISNLISSHIPYALNKHIDVELSSPESFYVDTDKLALSNVFTNLLENAIKYSPEKAKIKVTLKDITPFGATITIQDNGRGIPKESHEHLFSRFYRVPGTLETGSGLGLSIAYNLASKIGATLKVTEGLENKGIGFIIDLP